MSSDNQPTSRVLVLDDQPEHLAALKEFCGAQNLTLVRVAREHFVPTLSTNVELGAIVLAESYAGSDEETTDLAAFIRATRPEIPLVLRRERIDDADDVPDAFCAAYQTGDWDRLQRAFDEHIFALVYPNAFVRGIAEISETAFRDRFVGLELEAKMPCISRDRLIFGEVLSLIPLESAWCRGYMMLQLGEQGLRRYLTWRDPYSQNTFHTVNHILSETTNLIWGGIKNRFIGDDSRPRSAHVQVPIVINHEHRYISFGSENPQLCFQYRLRNPGSDIEIALNQRFVFSLNWSPEEFREIAFDGKDIAPAGELELF